MYIDAHTKVFPSSFAERRQTLATIDATFAELYGKSSRVLATTEQLLASLDAAKFDKAFLLNIGWQTLDACKESNDYLLTSAKKHAKRLVPFCAVNPMWGEARAVEEIERCASLGARGIGELHPDTQGYDIGNERLLEPIVKAAQRHKLVIATHASEPVGHHYGGKGQVTPEKLMKFASAFPEQAIIVAHWGGGLPFYALMPEVKKALQNIYFDSAASPFLYDREVFDVVAGLVGADHILFATDWPLIKHERLVKQVDASALTKDEKAHVMGGNAARLLGL